ncbi:hypothetical protein [Clostridium sp. UBA2485]|uniref:hypothetical protein n=1 Tax=Clostridium sp. UBA2485 TaxID=1946352 RepID=UPI0025C4282F|nr:hypothetical protein [Clostridium sp. UBA2485]
MKVKVSKVKPIYPLVMEFEDGTTKKAAFGVETFLLLQEEYGDLTVLSEMYKTEPYTLASMILHCGMKVMDFTVEYEEAQAIIVGGGIDMVNVVLGKVIESHEMDEELLKKKIQREVDRNMLMKATMQ